MGGRLWIEWSGDIARSRRLSIAADATAQSTVFYTPFNDTIQRQVLDSWASASNTDRAIVGGLLPGPP